MRRENGSNRIWKIFAILGCLVALGAIAYAVYRFFTPDYLEDFEDDFEDDFDDFFEPVAEADPVSPEKAAEEITDEPPKAEEAPKEAEGE